MYLETVVSFLTTSLASLENAQRGTGRTQFDLKNVKNDDIFITINDNIARSVCRDVRNERGISIITVTETSGDLHRVYDTIRDRTRGRRLADTNIIFSHEWLYLYAQRCVKMMKADIQQATNSLKQL